QTLRRVPLVRLPTLARVTLRRGQGGGQGKSARGGVRRMPPTDAEGRGAGRRETGGGRGADPGRPYSSQPSPRAGGGRGGGPGGVAAERRSKLDAGVAATGGQTVAS